MTTKTKTWQSQSNRTRKHLKVSGKKLKTSTGSATGSNHRLTKSLSRQLGDDYVLITSPQKLCVYSEKYGIVPTIKIVNVNTNKSLFVEIKYGEKGGNAHERVYKFLSPPLKKWVIEEFNAVEKPFFFIFSGSTFQKEKYQQEISFLLSEENYIVVEDIHKETDLLLKRITDII